MLENYLFIIHGDITQLAADVITYSTSPALRGDGQLYTSFRDNVPGFAAGLDALCRSGTPKKAGSVFWLPVEREDIRGVVVAVSIDQEKSRRRIVCEAVKNAIDEAVRRLGKPAPGTRFLVALPCFLMGAGGGSAQRLTLARAQVAEAAAALKRHKDVPLDVVFVAYTRSIYHLFLEARRALPPPAPPLKEELLPEEARKELIGALRQKECVLFVGSGISNGAGLASWSALNEEMERDLGFHPSRDRREFEYSIDLAQWYRDAFAENPRKLHQLVGRVFAAAEAHVKPTLDHYLLLALETPYLLTTNYDRLLEKTLAALRRPCNKIVQEDQVSRAGEEGGVCLVKLHGDAREGDDVVLSRDDYDHYFQDHPAMTLLLEGLLLQRTFLFVGYSLRDSDFRQIYNRIERMLRDAKRPAYATTFDFPSGQEQRMRKTQWERKKLYLIPFAGDQETQKALLRRWLSQLAEAVVESPPVFLAEGPKKSDVPSSLGKLRELLLATAREVETQILRAPPYASEEEARLLAPLLTLLASFGWRPLHAPSLSNLWTRLALSFPPESLERKRLLRTALEHTDQSAEVEPLQRLLQKEEGKRKAGRRKAKKLTPKHPTRVE